MKITYECEFCGFCSQNKDEVQRCEAQGVKTKFSVGEEVEYFHKGTNQWVKATIIAVHFEERTHKIRCYNIKPKRGIPVTAHKQGPNLVFEGGSVNEEELRPVPAVSNRTYKLTKEVTFPILADGGPSYCIKLVEIIERFAEKGFGDEIWGRITYKGDHSFNEGVASLIHITVSAEYDSVSDLQDMVEQIDRALRTEHSRVLRFT